MQYPCGVIALGHDAVAVGESDACFRVGELAATGLPDHSVDTIMSIDSIYFGKPLSATVAECARVLRSGGRLVATGWEPAEAQSRLGAALLEGGFREVRVDDQPDWYALEKQKWLAVAAIPNDGDAMLTAAQEEARSVLAVWDERRRVLVTAENPHRNSARTDAP